MNKLVTVSFLALSASSAFAQYCQVDMVDRYNRIVRTFQAYGDDRCVEGMKQCRKSIRLDPYSGGVDCIARGNNYPNPYPQPNPNPYPNPYPQYDISRYLRMTDYQLAQEAQRGIGRCIVSPGNYNSACQWYMKVGYAGFGGGTGCAKQQYTHSFGCNYYSEFENAGCLTRIALQQGQCF